MNKKIERLITIGMIAGLVGYFSYQVAYGEMPISKGKIQVPGWACDISGTVNGHYMGHATQEQ